MKQRKNLLLLLTVVGMLCLSTGCGSKDEAKGYLVEEKIQQQSKMEEYQGTGKYAEKYSEIPASTLNVIEQIGQSMIVDTYASGCTCDIKDDITVNNAHRDYDSYEFVGVCVGQTPKDKKYHNVVGLVYELHFSNFDDMTTYLIVCAHDVLDVDKDGSQINWNIEINYSLCREKAHGYMGARDIESAIDDLKDEWNVTGDVVYTDLK